MRLVPLFDTLEPAIENSLPLCIRVLLLTDTDTKIKKILQLYADTFGTMGNHIGRDLQSMYPDVWQGWQDFHRRTIHTVIELIKIGTDEGLYRNVNLSVVEESLTVLFEALGSSEFLNRTNFSTAYNGRFFCCVND